MEKTSQHIIMRRLDEINADVSHYKDLLNANQDFDLEGLDTKINSVCNMIGMLSKEEYGDIKESFLHTYSLVSDLKTLINQKIAEVSSRISQITEANETIEKYIKAANDNSN